MGRKFVKRVAADTGFDLAYRHQAGKDRPTKLMADILGQLAAAVGNGVISEDQYVEIMQRKWFHIVGRFHIARRVGAEKMALLGLNNVPLMEFVFHPEVIKEVEEEEKNAPQAT